MTFDGAGPVAQAILTYSQSTDPASPHDADQTVLFSQKRWVTLPFSAAAIAADPALTTLKLSEQGVTGFGKSFVSAAQHAWSVC